MSGLLFNTPPLDITFDGKQKNPYCIVSDSSASGPICAIADASFAYAAKNVVKFSDGSSRKIETSVTALSAQNSQLAIGDRWGRLHLGKDKSCDAHGERGTYAISFVGERIVSSGNHSLIKMWDSSLSPAGQMGLDVGPPVCTLCSLDRYQLVSSGTDNTIRVWDVARLAETVAVPTHSPLHGAEIAKISMSGR